MAQHCYTLQMHLYTVALHRYLRSRLGGRYDPAWHLGGAAYLFLRGIDATRPQLGVHFQQPEIETVFALDRLLAGPE
jgi:exodeoxyribonuclease V beta subunit